MEFLLSFIDLIIHVIAFCFLVFVVMCISAGLLFVCMKFPVTGGILAIAVGASCLAYVLEDF